MYNFPSLTRKDWATDYGFRKALAADPGTMKFAGQTVGTGRRDIVEYWQREKSHYRLWELLLYMGSHAVPRTVTYFDLPADTAEFLHWCTTTFPTSSASRCRKWCRALPAASTR